MAGNLQSNYGASGQSITVSIAGLVNGNARASTAVDDSANFYFDELVSVAVKSGASATLASGYVNVYAYASVDGGTTYTEGATGSDAAITLTNPPNAIRIGSINVVANATTYYGGPFSIAQAFGGTLPPKWGIIIENQSGGTLDVTETNHIKKHQGVYGQYT
jgi:hypothetical protein